MARVEFNDREPGTPPEVRRIAGGALAILINIASDHRARGRDQLVLRWEPEGHLYAALMRIPENPDEPHRG
jgi:hypothetical protein